MLFHSNRYFVIRIYMRNRNSLEEMNFVGVNVINNKE
jgi:hypothetical protein